MRSIVSTPGSAGSGPRRIRPARGFVAYLAAWALAASAGAQGWNVDLVGACATPGTAWDVYVVGDYAYVADCESGLRVIDISDPAAPTICGARDTPSCARAVHVNAGTAYVADWHSALQIIDVRDPAFPWPLSVCSAPGDEEDVFVVDGYAYVAGGVPGLHVIDVGDPMEPLLQGTCDVPGDADGVFVRGNLAYLACGGYDSEQGGLHIIDVSHPVNPTLVGSYLTPSYARDVQVVGSLAFVANGDSGLRIFDVSDPSLPTVVSTSDTPGSALGLCVAGDLAYVASGGGGLQVIDVSAPSSPTLRGLYETPSHAYAVVLSGGLAYVACRESGLLVLRFTGPQTPRELFVDDDAPNDPGPGDPTVSDPLEDGTPARPFDAIQEAIDTAHEGDTVSVLDGTYAGLGNRDVDFLGKAITVRSQNGPTRCIVDCQYASLEEMHRGFYFRNGEDNRSILEGFTITNGFHGNGGAIRCEGASPTIRDNIITSNTAESDGDGGGGISCFHGGSPVIVHNIIRGNDGGVGGGAIRCYEAEAPLIAHNVITGNVAGWGGGIVCDWCASSTIISNTITDNTAQFGSGGGLSTWGPAMIANNLIARNTSTGVGGGVACGEVSTPVLTNNTIVGNTATHGGGIAGTFGACPIMTNCILWDNAADWGPEMSLLYPSHLTVRHCDVAGGATAAYIEPPCALDWGVGNLTGDPKYVDAANGDYRLWQISPCIDAGDNAALPSDIADLDGDGDTSEPLPLDLDGHPRIHNVAVDMGAYEFGSSPPPSRLYVDEDATGANNGTSWADALSDLRDALDLAGLWPGYVREIWVAEGVYKPDRGTGDREATFQLVDGAAVYGGFAATETDLDQRDVAANETILSGDLADDDGPDFVNYGENSCHVVTCPGAAGPSTILDGFTITGGCADGSGPFQASAGGGLYNPAGSPTVRNCTFRANAAQGPPACGGGLSNYSGNPTIENCLFVGNLAEDLSQLYGTASGGGMYSYGGHPTLRDCTFHGNCSRARDGTGGGLWTYEGNPVLINCAFLGNRTDDAGALSNTPDGAGLWNYAGAPTLINCLFSGNTSARDGGALWNYEGHPTLINCTMCGNGALGDVGGLYNHCGNPTLTNCILWGNFDAENPNPKAQIFIGVGTPVVNYCCIQGWTSGWGGIGNLCADPLFADPEGPDGVAGTPDDDARLRPGSPCIDAGDNAALPHDALDLDGDGDTSEPLPLDLDGHPRIISGTVDMGGYEYASAPPPPRLYVDEKATGANNGTRWADAFNDLQDALELAGQWPGGVSAVWVADGTYKPDRGTGDRAATFQLVSGVAVYGGFTGVETALDQRDVAANETILSGDLAGDDAPVSHPADLLDEPTRAENSRHVVTSIGTNATAILDGFVITGGRAEGLHPDGAGGGMYSSGGGMDIYGDGTPTLINCTFRGNSATWGGAMENRDSCPTLINCTFQGNAAGNGGGLRNRGDSPNLINCMFSGNVATNGGALSGGGRLTNCTLAGNSAGRGSGIWGDDDAGSLILANCILWGNTDWDGGTSESAQINVYYSPEVNYTCIQGWTGALGGSGNHGLDPLFLDADGPDETSGTVDDNLRLRVGSPCRDSGDNAALPPDAFDVDVDGDTSEPIPLDLDGNPRVLDDTVDMGAYECTEPANLPATIWILPRTLNRKSNGRWVMCWIELPEAYAARDIDADSLRLNETVAPAPHPRAIGDHNENGVLDLMIKFPRDEVIATVGVGEDIVVTVTGTVGGTPFGGTDTIRVIEPGVGDRRAAPGQPLVFSVACLAEGLKGPVTYAGENLPAGATLDAATGLFRWTPAPDQLGVYPDVLFRASDREEEVVDIVTIVVEHATGVTIRIWRQYR